MNLKLSAYQKKTASLATVTCSSLLLTLPYAFRDPDPHHDGYQYGSALGVSEGLQIHSEVFNQYGPVTAWVQGITLWLFGPELILIRLLNVFLVTLISILMYLVLERTFQKKLVAILIPLTWVASCPDWSVSPGTFNFWPWPSVLFELLMLLAFYLYLLSRLNGAQFSNHMILATGFFVGISIFTRLQNGVLLYATIIFILLAIERNGFIKSRRVWLFVLGSSISIGGITYYLFTNALMDYYLEQAVYGAAEKYGQTLVNWFFLFTYYLIPATLFGILGLFLLITLSSQRRAQQWCFGVLTLTYFLALVEVSLIKSRLSANFLMQHNVFRDSLMNTPMFISVLAAVVAFLIPIALGLYLYAMKLDWSPKTDWLRSKTLDDIVEPIVFSAFALVSISQIFPVHDMYHLWWASPMAILSFVIFCKYVFPNEKALLATVGTFVSMSLILGLVPWQRELAEPRVQILDGSLKYMYVTKQRWLQNSEVLAMLSSVEANSATFYCRDGLVSTWTAKYMSSSPRYVDWAYGTDAHTPDNSERVFICSNNEENTRIWANSAGYRLTNDGVPVNFSYFSGFVLYEAVKTRTGGFNGG